MEKTWFDDEGRLRLRSDGNQFVSHGTSPLGLDPWLSYDSWDTKLAVKLITIGYNLDIKSYWDEAKDWPEGSTGLDRGRAYIEVYNRGMSIAESSIAAGLLKNPDTPANWLAWAKRKGYKTDHLSPRTAIINLELAIDGCKNEGVMESYTEQIENLKQLAAIVEPMQPDTQPQAGTETKEQRQDRRLKMCEDDGLKMDKRALSRLPDGVGDVAAREGVTRQAFTDDVKAALSRREAASCEGGTVHRA